MQVGGRRIGSVDEITLTDDNQARACASRSRSPTRRCARARTAMIRLTSLSGIANRYIALDAGAELGQGARRRRDAGGRARRPTVVDLDQLFNTLDPETRKDLQGVIQGFATQYDGKGKEAGESAEYFNPFLSTSRQLVNQLTQDEGTLTDFIVNSSRAVTAVAERARRPRLARRQHEHDGGRDRQRERRARRRRSALLPTTLRRAQHDVRQPARDARRPRPAGRGVQAGDQGAGAVPARAAPAGRERDAHDRRPAPPSPARAPTTT